MIIDPTDVYGQELGAMISTGAVGGVRAILSFTNKETLSGTTDGVTFASSSVTLNGVCYVGVSFRNGGVVPTLAVTSTGRTWVECDAAQRGTLSGTGGLRVFRSYSAADTTGAVTFTFDGSQTSCIWSIVQVGNADVSGTHGSGATVQARANSAIAAVTVGQTFAVALENEANACLAFAAIAANAAITADAQFSQIGEDGEASTVQAQESSFAIGQSSCDVTFSSTNGCIIIVEVKAAEV